MTSPSAIFFYSDGIRTRRPRAFRIFSVCLQPIPCYGLAPGFALINTGHFPSISRYASGAAPLWIPIDSRAVDDDGLFAGCRTQLHVCADPSHLPVLGPESRFSELGAVARRASVGLYGEGPDNALWYEWKPYVLNELKR